MRKVSVREARQHIGRLLDLVQAGEEIVITRRGKAAVRMVKPDADEEIRGFPERDEFRAALSSFAKLSAVELMRGVRNER